MTAAQKSKELVDKFKDFAHGYRAEGYNKQLFENAKQCALIAVEEIINLEDHFIDEGDMLLTYSELEYWEQVKEEIIKQQ